MLSRYVPITRDLVESADDVVHT
jgi:hypothetical protein